MPRTAPPESVKNPTAYWLEWKGGEGKTPAEVAGRLTYYDKEKKERLIMPLPLVFLVLNDQLSTVTGYNKKRKASIFANEVREIGTSPLVVKYHGDPDPIAIGTWKSIKDRVCSKQVGGSFAKSVYVAFRPAQGAPMALGNIRMSGCALHPWFEFTDKSKNDLYSKAVVMRAGVKDESGSVDFTPPTFSTKEVSAATDDEAGVLQKQINDYIALYLKKQTVGAPDPALDQRTGYDDAEADQRRPADDEPEEYCEQVARRPHPSDPDPDEDPEIPF